MAETTEELRELERKQEEHYKTLLEVEKNIHRKEVTFNTDNYVVMANNMVLHSASNLSLNELKLLRFFIMQSEMGDSELYAFQVSAKDIGKLLGIKSKDLYKRLDTMTTHIVSEVIRIGDDSKQVWKKRNWCHICDYENGILTVQLHEDLKPYLLELQGCFTRYQLSEIIRLNSTYAIRIYEMLIGYMDENNLPYADNSVEISISIDELRKNTDTLNKFERPYDFKRKVVDTAIKEINAKSKYHVIATPYKSGKAIKGFEFLIESQAGYQIRTQDQQTVEKQIDGQMNLLDYQDTNGTIRIH